MGCPAETTRVRADVRRVRCQPTGPVQHGCPCRRADLRVIRRRCQASKVPGVTSPAAPQRGWQLVGRQSLSLIPPTCGITL